MPWTAVSFKGKRVDDDGAEGGFGEGREEIVAGGGGEGAVQGLQREGGQEAEGVEVAGVVGDHHEGARGGEGLLVFDPQAVIGTEPAATGKSGGAAETVDQHVGFARELTQAFGERLVEVLGGVVVPRIHVVGG